MSTVYSLLLDFTKQEENTGCSGLLLQVPEQEVAAGDEVEIRLWGVERLLSESWVLYQGGACLGVGKIAYDWFRAPDGAGGTRPESDKAGVFEQIVHFENAYEAQLELPFQEILSVKAVSALCVIGADGKPRIHTPRGASCSGTCGGKWSRKGYSCLRLTEEQPLYGTLLVRARNIRTYRRWTWTVPAGAAGPAWFFLYQNGALYKNFTIELPELELPEDGERNITLKVIDHAAETAIAGAQVSIDGRPAGSTDANGELRLDAVPTGDHSISITAAGYLSTEEDELSNESISVV